MKQSECPRCRQMPAPGTTEHLQLTRCGRCGLVWTVISETMDADQLYSDEVYQVVDNRGSIFERIIFFEARAVLRRAKRLLGKSNPRLLDFGCGKGQFLAQAAEGGWMACGIETSADRARFAREQYGQEVSASLYESGVVGEGNFDLISLNHVLEHLPEPMSLLHELFSANLAPGGMAYIEVPRLDAWQSKIAGGDWMHLDIPKHLSHWTEPQLTSALAELGYRVTARRRFSFHLGVLGMLQALGSKVGYRDNIIVGLKRKCSAKLLLLVACLTPLALILESLSCLFNRPGIMGLYARRELPDS